jgi:hypothetical protein
MWKYAVAPYLSYCILIFIIFLSFFQTRLLYNRRANKMAAANLSLYLFLRQKHNEKYHKADDNLFF